MVHSIVQKTAEPYLLVMSYISCNCYPAIEPNTTLTRSDLNIIQTCCSQYMLSSNVEDTIGQWSDMIWWKTELGGIHDVFHTL